MYYNTRPNQRIYVQVAWLIDSEATFNREFGALQSIIDAYPKTSSPPAPCCALPITMASRTSICASS